MSSVTVVTFYKVVSIQNVHKLKREVERIAFKENLSGTFFATTQGINTTLAGNRKGLENLISLLKDTFLIKGLEPTWSESFKTAFKILKVRIKDKLLPLEGDCDIFDLKGNHVDPKDWNDLLEDPEAIALDVRNEYETRIGSFKNSLIPETLNTIYEDNDGTIWLASLKGVSKFINGKFNSFYYNLKSRLQRFT